MKSRHNHPPGGWMFFQAETGWQGPQWVSFDALVAAVIEHRKANAGRFPKLSQDRATVEQEVDAYNAQRMKDINGGMSYVQDGGGSPPGFPTSHHQRQAVGLVVGVKAHVQNAVAGIGLWMDWFGNDPVERTLAENRAAVCIACPLNIQGDVIQRFNAKTGKELLEIFGSMRKRKMETPYDAKLGVCAACDCPMRAKVWVPIDLIETHLRPEAREKLWAACWIRKELLEQNPVDSGKSE